MALDEIKQLCVITWGKNGAQEIFPFKPDSGEENLSADSYAKNLLNIW